MGDIINFDDAVEHVYDRSCGECGAAIFTWHSSDEHEADAHVLACVECGATYAISGEEMQF